MRDPTCLSSPRLFRDATSPRDRTRRGVAIVSRRGVDAIPPGTPRRQSQPRGVAATRVSRTGHRRAPPRAESRACTSGTLVRAEGERPRTIESNTTRGRNPRSRGTRTCPSRAARPRRRRPSRRLRPRAARVPAPSRCGRRRATRRPFLSRRRRSTPRRNRARGRPPSPPTRRGGAASPSPGPRARRGARRAAQRGARRAARRRPRAARRRPRAARRGRASMLGDGGLFHGRRLRVAASIDSCATAIYHETARGAGVLLKNLCSITKRSASGSRANGSVVNRSLRCLLDCSLARVDDTRPSPASIKKAAPTGARPVARSPACGAALACASPSPVRRLSTRPVAAAPRCQAGRGQDSDATVAKMDRLEALRKLDMYPKAKEEFRVRTMQGGLSTLVAAVVALARRPRGDLSPDATRRRRGGTEFFGFADVGRPDSGSRGPSGSRRHEFGRTRAVWILDLVAEVTRAREPEASRRRRGARPRPPRAGPAVPAPRPARPPDRRPATGPPPRTVPATGPPPRRPANRIGHCTGGPRDPGVQTGPGRRGPYRRPSGGGATAPGDRRRSSAPRCATRSRSRRTTGSS